MKPFDLESYVRRTTRSSGVPLRVTACAALALVVRLLTK